MKTQKHPALAAVTAIFLFGFAANFAFAGGESEPAQGKLPPITIPIVNRTGFTIHALYVSPADSDSWGTDVLNGRTIQRGERGTIQLAENRYDIRMIDSDGDTYTKWDIYVGPDDELLFSIYDFDYDSNRERTIPGTQSIRVFNVTDFSFYSVYIVDSESYDGTWGPNRLPQNEALLDMDYVILELRDSRKLGRYHIRAVNSYGDIYTHWNVLLANGGGVSFSNWDKD